MAGDVRVAVVNGVFGGTVVDTTLDLTETGFGTPKAAMIMVSRAANDDGTPESHLGLSIGFTDFTDDRYLSIQAEDAGTNEDCDEIKGLNNVFMIMDVAGSDGGSGSVSTITDGIRLNVDVALDIQYRVTAVLFGGADLTAKVGSHTLTNVLVGETNTDDPGIAWDMLFFLSIESANEDSKQVDVEMSFGVATRDLTQKATGFAINHNQATGRPSAVMRNNRCCNVLKDNGIEAISLELTAAGTTNFTTTVRENDIASGRKAYFLALTLDDRSFEVGSIDSPTASGDWSKTGLGFMPQVVGLGLLAVTSENVVDESGPAGSLGFSFNSGSGAEGCASAYDEDGAATINTNSLYKTQAVLLLDDVTTSTLYDLDHSSFDSGGWTYSQTGTPSVTATKWWYWSIEEAAVAGLPPGQMMLVGVGR